MESSGHNRANVLPPNYNKMLIFGKSVFFIMLFPNILTNPIISKIQIFVTSHFRTQLLQYILSSNRCCMNIDSFLYCFPLCLTEELIKRFALFKRNCFASVFEKYFDYQAAGSGGETHAVINYREDESM